MKILVVCLGNICRSAMLEGWLREAIASQSFRYAGIEIDSAGISREHQGEPPDPRSIRCAKGHGVDIADLRARQITDADFDTFDLILCADASTTASAHHRAGEGRRAEVVRLMEWLGLDPPDLADPWYGDMHDFEACWARIVEAGPLILERAERMRSQQSQSHADA